MARKVIIETADRTTFGTIEEQWYNGELKPGDRTYVNFKIAVERVVCKEPSATLADDELRVVILPTGDSVK